MDVIRMRIVNVNPVDTGGQVARLSGMINEHTKHESRGFVKGLNYIRYPTDVLYKPGWKVMPGWIKQYWATADVIHVHNKYVYAKGWSRPNPKAGWVMHQHGRMPTKVRPARFREDKNRRAVRVVSTINLLPYVNDNVKRWFPTPVDLPYMTTVRKEFRKDHDTIRIIHSPTQRKLKHTDLFIKTASRLREKHRNIEIVLVERKTYERVQQIRANTDICFDQLLLQYGSNGIEAMAMGIPVIAGCVGAQGTSDRIRDITGVCPYINATEKNLYDKLETLILDESLRKEYGRIGYDYVRKWHSPPYVTNLAVKTYKEAIDLRK
jgi:glycosyltransferase involved in cell wall biosynthesis